MRIKDLLFKSVQTYYEMDLIAIELCKERFYIEKNIYGIAKTIVYSSGELNDLCRLAEKITIIKLNRLNRDIASKVMEIVQKRLQENKKSLKTDISKMGVVATYKPEKVYDNLQPDLEREYSIKTKVDNFRKVIGQIFYTDNVNKYLRIRDKHGNQGVILYRDIVDIKEVEKIIQDKIFIKRELMKDTYEIGSEFGTMKGQVLNIEKDDIFDLSITIKREDGIEMRIMNDSIFSIKKIDN